MKKLLLTGLLIFGFLQQGISQKFDYDQTSNFFIGLNAGYLWHTSDVKNDKNRFPLGAGFTIGGTFNRDYGKLFTYDLQFRFLFGSWYGQDRDTTHAIQENYAVNSLYDTLGYAVQNFRAKQRSLDLEFAVHFNRVKERTGLDPYIFGGIGFTFTKTQGDLLKYKDNKGGVIYSYNENPTGDLITKNYNTPLDKNSSGESYDEFEANFLPSLGVGIGYYFNSSFSVGLEHRTTFFNSDYFDGTRVNQEGQASKIKKDLFHYTSIYFKWYLRGSKKKEVNPEEETYTPPRNPAIQDPVTQNPNDETDIDREPTRKRPPIVNFTNPTKNPLRTTQSTISIQAKTSYINKSEDITFTQNGREHGTFIFNPRNEVFTSKVKLNSGKNVFKITGINSDGSDSDETVVYYEREVPEDVYPPTVNITAPANSPFNVNHLNYVVKAAIHNVKARNQVTVIFNDQPFTAFSFDPNGEINFSANLNLKAGVNTLKITGKNTVGTAVDETALIYSRAITEDSGTPPIVKIIVPDKNPFTTSKTEVPITAKIENVLDNQQIEVIVNGVSTTNFNFNSGTKMAQFIAGVSVGYNSIRVKAKNAYGSDMDEMQIIYQEGYNPSGSNLPPLVSITSPNVNPYTSENAIQEVTARVEHIEHKQQIEVRVNGVEISNFNYTQSAGSVQFYANLIAGSNIINVKGTNNFGSDSDVSQIIYRQKVIKGDPPKVKIISPSSNPLITSRSSEEVVAEVENIHHKDQLKVMVNGVNTTNFTFTPSTGTVQLNVDLLLGNTIVKVKGTNNFGSAVDETQINRKKEELPAANEGIETRPCDPPSIKFIAPEQSPLTLNQASFEVIAKLSNIQNKNQITVLLNSRKVTDFSYDVVTGLLKHTINLKNGVSTYEVAMTNKCASKKSNISIEYKPSSCGVDISLNKNDFCLVSSEGTIQNNDLLSNSNYQFDGVSKSFYFLAANDGLAKVNGQDFPLIKGMYYYFQVQSAVHLQKINNQWHVCVQSIRKPLSGKGSTRPDYPCEESTKQDSEEGSNKATPIKENAKPTTRPHPTRTTKPSRRTPKESSTKDAEETPKQEPTRPAHRTNKNPRKPTRGR